MKYEVCSRRNILRLYAKCKVCRDDALQRLYRSIKFQQAPAASLRVQPLTFILSPFPFSLSPFPPILPLSVHICSTTFRLGNPEQSILLRGCDRVPLLSQADLLNIYKVNIPPSAVASRHKFLYV